MFASGDAGGTWIVRSMRATRVELRIGLLRAGAMRCADIVRRWGVALVDMAARMQTFIGASGRRARLRNRYDDRARVRSRDDLRERQEYDQQCCDSSHREFRGSIDL